MQTQQQWQCMVCGYVHSGAMPPDECPVCGTPFSAFQRWSPRDYPTPSRLETRPAGYRFVIIGNSSAGRSAAQSILRLIPEANVTIVSDETVPFYYRPILPDFIGGIPEAKVFRAAQDVHDGRITLLLGESVRQVDISSRRLVCASRREIPFDLLLIATGSEPVMIPWPGADGHGLAYFRTFADARAIASMADHARRVVVVGGGLLGLEFVRAFLLRGLNVTLLVRENRIGSPGLDAEAGTIILQRLHELGVTVALEEEVVAFESQDGKVRCVHTSRNRSLPCDLVGVAVGARPRVGFLAGSGIRCDRGVLVNEHFETNVPGIFAAGDVAQAYDIAYGVPRINTSWRTAKEHGEIAGYNMAGADVRYSGAVGSNFQMFGGVAFVSVGLGNPTDPQSRIEKEFDPDRNHYRKLVYRKDALVGAVLVGNTAEATDLEIQILGVYTSQSEPEEKNKGGTTYMHKMTEENVKAAFAGESQAHMKYISFAEKAKKEGKPNVSRLFSAASFAEQVHASAHLRVLKGVGDTSANLAAAIAGEDFEVTEMYPAYIAVAEAQSETAAKRSFHWASEAEKVHRSLYERSKEAVDAGKDADIGDIMVCGACGFTLEGDAPDECPLCGAPKERFVKF